VGSLDFHLQCLYAVSGISFSISGSYRIFVLFISSTICSSCVVGSLCGSSSSSCVVCASCMSDVFSLCVFTPVLFSMSAISRILLFAISHVLLFVISITLLYCIVPVLPTPVLTPVISGLLYSLFSSGLLL